MKLKKYLFIFFFSFLFLISNVSALKLVNFTDDFILSDDYKSRVINNVSKNELVDLCNSVSLPSTMNQKYVCSLLDVTKIKRVSSLDLSSYDSDNYLVFSLYAFSNRFPSLFNYVSANTYYYPNDHLLGVYYGTSYDYEIRLYVCIYDVLNDSFSYSWVSTSYQGFVMNYVSSNYTSSSLPSLYFNTFYYYGFDSFSKYNSSPYYWSYDISCSNFSTVGNSLNNSDLLDNFHRSDMNSWFNGVNYEPITNGSEITDLVTVKVNTLEANSTGSFSLLYHFDTNNVSSNDFFIYQYGANYETNISNVSCELDVNNETNCVLDISYTFPENIENGYKLMFDVKFPRKLGFRLYSATDDDLSFAYNLEQLEQLYEYKILSLDDLSLNDGGIFYFRNYGMLDYREDLKDIPFNVIYDDFLPGFLGNLVNTNLFGYASTFFNINNGLISIPSFTTTIFSSTLELSLLNYKYNSIDYDSSSFPCFFILDNVNNSDSISIKFNSSIFNFRLLNYDFENDNYHFIGVDSFDFVPYVDKNNISSNSSNSNSYVNNVSGNVDFSFTFSFTDDISGYMKTGFSYWRDKIVSMFDYVKQFFDTMPIKYQNCMIFVFMLGIALILFRLLL